jgi:hypothetical protein
VKRLVEQSLYEILEVPLDASIPEIKKAYERAKTLYGPGSIATYSLMAPDEAAFLSERIEEARAVLLDPRARTAYDARLARGELDVPEDTDEQEASAGAGEGHGDEAERLAGHGGGDAEDPAAADADEREDEAPDRDGDDEGGALAADGAGDEETEAEVRAAGAETVRADGAAEANGAVARRRPILLEKVVEAGTTASGVERGRAVPSLRANGHAAQASGPPPRKVELGELPIGEGTIFSGATLRRMREARGLSIAQLCERTKVTRHHLENIEADRFESLPAPVYLRGILMTLAKELRLDAQKVARSYMDRTGVGGQPAAARPR